MRRVGSQLSWRPSLLIANVVVGSPLRKGKRLQASDLAEGVTRVRGNLMVLCSGACMKGANPSLEEQWADSASGPWQVPGLAASPRAPVALRGRAGWPGRNPLPQPPHPLLLCDMSYGSRHARSTEAEETSVAGGQQKPQLPKGLAWKPRSRGQG